MPETLTESFCERCGTRYTFESVAQPTQKRLGKIKVLSKGLKNFVMDDDVALDEALAQARTEEERVVVSQQLDAFHDTFNFCMSCRQYTCANCWNDVEGRCQSCAPMIGGDFIDEQTARSGKGRAKGAKRSPKPSVDELAWPTTDLRRFEGGKQAAEPEPPQPATAPSPAKPAPAKGQQPKPERAAASGAGVVAPEAWPELPTLADRLKKVASAPAKPADAPVEWPTVDRVLDRPAAAAPPVPSTPPASAAPRTRRGVPSSFTPGQSIDEALEAYEAERRLDEAQVAAELSRAKAAREAAARETAAKEAAAREAAAREAAAREAAAREAAARETAAREAEAARQAMERQAAAREAMAREAEARAIAAREAAAREAAAKEAAARAAAEREAAEREAAERLAAEQEAAELEAAARDALERQAVEREEAARDAAQRNIVDGTRGSVRGGRQPRGDDRVEMPEWPVEPGLTPGAPRHDRGRPAEPVAASAQPAVPSEPQWPNEPAVDTLAFLANRSAATARGMEEVWASSTRDLLGASAGDVATTGVQECVSCGLSLSATARFCRRCGTRQA
jgi:hypothetical protein